MLKIGTIRKKITPEVGTLLAGYAAEVVADGIHDDLYISGLAFDDGQSKAIMLSYDLLGLDEDIVRNIRRECASVVGIESSSIILTCTHTHSAPHTRRNAIAELDEGYVRDLVRWSAEAVSNAFDDMQPVTLYHYSGKCDENINRRIISPDNSCEMVTDSKHLVLLADGITDPELGLLFFVDESQQLPIATLANYAAHPLTCQTGGASSHKITSDYPGELRNYVEKELGGFCIFTSGACGNIHPKQFESGFARTKEMGEAIGRKTAEHFFDALRKPECFNLKDTEITTHSEYVEVDLRESGGESLSSLYRNKDKIQLEVQFLAIGDICFVGIPGELLVEPGLEIKWHSPFRKTFLLYNSTAYISYIPHTNSFVAGGYETDTALLSPNAAFKIVSAAVDGMNALHEKERLL
jgi:neutral/alkaline ceramidase-like enzyme